MHRDVPDRHRAASGVRKPVEAVRATDHDHGKQQADDRSGDREAARALEESEQAEQQADRREQAGERQDETDQPERVAFGLSAVVGVLRVLIELTALRRAVIGIVHEWCFRTGD
ncbi:hypothetical protein ABWH91_01015 [Phycisphaerales bacterium ac7]